MLDGVSWMHLHLQMAWGQFPQLALATQICLYLALPLNGGGQLLQENIAYVTCLSLASLGGVTLKKGLVFLQDVALQNGHRKGNPSKGWEASVKPNLCPDALFSLLFFEGALGVLTA
jgi:hypothetical protein